MLLRLLGKTGLIPLGTGDRKYHGINNWFARRPIDAKNGQGDVVERWWMEKFMRRVAAHAVKGPKCLEWDAHFYTDMVPACTEKFAFVYSDKKDKAGVDLEKKRVRGDILNLPQILGPEHKMDVIMFTQVFEHLAEPMLAVKALYEALAPGGAVVLTAPHLSPYHGVPHDYFRYTVEGVKYSLVKAGFCVPNKYFSGGGDFIFDIGRDAGLKVEDFSTEEMESALDIGYDKVSHSAIVLMCVGFKAPHAACNDPTSGKDELVRTGTWQTLSMLTATPSTYERTTQHIERVA